jgi:stage IV sporulation protein FB
MFGDPSPTEFDLRFRIFGIPVRVHPLFWLVAAVLGWNEQHPNHLLIWIPAVFVSIVIHEMGHALCARSLGNSPWIVLYGFGGFAAYHERWNVTTWQRVAITFCGPLAGFAFAAVVFGTTIGFGAPRTEVLSTLVTYLLFINLFWGLFNLLPVWPLDGGKISYYVLQRLSPARGPGVARGLSVVCAGLLAVGAAMISEFFLAVFFGILAVQSLQGRGMYR